MTLRSEELALHLLFQGQDQRDLLVIDSSPLTLAILCGAEPTGRLCDKDKVKVWALLHSPPTYH